MQFRVPTKKIAKLRANWIPLFRRALLIRDLALVAGFIDSLYLAVGPIAKLFTRQIHSTIKARSRWNRSFSSSAPLLEELRFWFSNIAAFNGNGIQPKFCPGAVIFCDASDYAFGGFQFRLNDQPVSGMFTPFESQQRSTFRELKANFYVIKAHVVSLRHKKVTFSMLMRTLPELYRLAAPSSIFSLWKSISASYVWRMTCSVDSS